MFDKPSLTTRIAIGKGIIPSEHAGRRHPVVFTHYAPISGAIYKL
jgi:hypothetical protein